MITLPFQDKDPKMRNFFLQQSRSEYRYNYDLIPPLAISDTVPEAELPKFGWIFQLLQVGAKLIENSISTKEGIARKFRIVLSSNLFRIRMLVKILFSLSDPTNFFTSAGEYILKYLRKGEGVLLEEYNDLFKTIEIPRKDRDFLSDENFVKMRLAGWNPCLIESIDKLPKKLALTDSILRLAKGFKNDSVESCLKEKRMFLVDYKDLSFLENGFQPNGEKFCYAPIAVLAKSKKSNELTLVAIQTGQDSKKFPIFSTGSDYWAWQMAKAVVNSADGNHHELISHLGLTHLVTEPFVIATHRQLSKFHPIFQLLVPHFTGTIFINHLAKTKLIAPNGGVDYLLSGSIQSDVTVTIQNHLKYGFNDLDFPSQLKRRKIYDPKILEYYPYRDDGLLVWNAIQNWVGSYLNLYYPDNSFITKDYELELWAKEIVSELGGRVKNFGEDGNGKITTISYLTKAITQIIFTCSAGHSSVNFPQKELMIYAPEVPLGLYDKAPDSGREYTEKDYFSMLPTLDMASLQLNLGYTLGAIYYTKLGEYKNFEDRKVFSILQKFQKELKEIEQVIEERNKNRYSYTFMLPSKITQSINI
ncbi:MAG: lipoxygenase family protein [Leptospiraceae bacterium]|nr:lipoxygenase family protein [Leptospiraceae bacterium]